MLFNQSPFRAIIDYCGRSPLGLADSSRSSCNEPPPADGAPVLTMSQSEHITPSVDVVTTVKAPTVPNPANGIEKDGDIGGLMIGSGADNIGTAKGGLSKTNQTVQVAGLAVAKR